jgi:hypothetical protein
MAGRRIYADSTTVYFVSGLSKNPFNNVHMPIELLRVMASLLVHTLCAVRSTVFGLLVADYFLYFPYRFSNICSQRAFPGGEKK